MDNGQNLDAATSSRKEIEIGNTVYRVTSVFLGEKDLGKTLEQLTIRKAMNDIKAGTAAENGP